MSALSKKLDGLSFETVVAPPPNFKGPTVKISVRAGNMIVISFNNAILDGFGEDVQKLIVQCAERNGEHFIRLSPGASPAAFSLIRGARKMGSRLNLRAHPFEPGVEHRAMRVAHQWDGNILTLQCPDWGEMLGSLEEEEETE